MRRIFIITISLVFFTAAMLMAQQKKEAPSELDKKVDALIAKMTLEEKVGQMT